MNSNPSRSPALFLVAAFSLAPIGCSPSAPAEDTTAPVNAGIDQPYFPLIAGTVRVYEGEHEGRFRREVEETLDETRDILGTTCTGVRQEMYLDGTLAEVTTEWFAQDEMGDLWKFGEETFELKAGELVRGGDSWIAGVGPGLPWLAFSKDPLPGDTYVGYRPGGTDVYHVLATDQTALLPAGTFPACLEVEENPLDPNDKDIILYSRGVGRVVERSKSGRIVLVSRRRK